MAISRQRYGGPLTLASQHEDLNLVEIYQSFNVLSA